MDLMNRVLQPYLDQFVVAFINDILVYYRNERGHEKPLRIVLRTLREHQLYTKFSKWDFCLKELHFLGHAILADGIMVNPTKVKADFGMELS